MWKFAYLNSSAEDDKRHVKNLKYHVCQYLEYHGIIYNVLQYFQRWQVVDRNVTWAVQKLRQLNEICSETEY